MERIDSFLREHLKVNFECEQKNNMLFITLNDFDGDMLIMSCRLREVFEKEGLTDYELILMNDRRLVYTDFKYRLHQELNRTFEGAWIAFVWYTDSAYIQAVASYIKNSQLG